jgi:hypothetical protein
MSLTGAWAKLQMQMEMDRIRANYDTQQKILELHKSMWDRDDKKNSDMLTIQNINKIVGRTFHIGGNILTIGRIFDVYEWIDNRYEFIVEISTPDGKIKQFSLNLNREKIPYPIVLKDCWELSYEEKPNQLKVEALGKGDLRNMGEVIRRICNLMERVLNP